MSNKKLKKTPSKVRSQQTAAILSSQQILGFLVLVLSVVSSAILVIYSAHVNRDLINELQNLQRERNDYQVEWGQLLLEQRTWASHGRIESIVAKNLNMKVPKSNEIIMVKP